MGDGVPFVEWANESRYAARLSLEASRSESEPLRWRFSRMPWTRSRVIYPWAG